jgi:hypothetical protein
MNSNGSQSKLLHTLFWIKALFAIVLAFGLLGYLSREVYLKHGAALDKIADDLIVDQGPGGF